MTAPKPDPVQDLLRRVDEVRGLSDRNESRAPLDPGDREALLRTLHELVEELERSHRRLIETNVQLVSLREVASQMTGSLDDGETSITVARYLCRAFGFDHVFLMLVNRESGRLEGTWTRRAGERDVSAPLEIELVGDPGTLARAVWQNRTVTQHHPRRHPPCVVHDGHPLEDVFASLGGVVCVPLQRSHAVQPRGEGHELCGDRCTIGEAALLAPPPGVSADEWAHEREERQRHCMACELMPLLGVIGVARAEGAPPFQSGDITLLESIALSVAPVVENARLYQDLRKSERFREHVLDSMASGLVAVNMKGEILAFNRAAEALLSVSEAEVLGQPFGAVCGADGEALVQATLEHGREALRQETFLRGRDGSALPVSLTTSLLRSERRTVYGAIATFMDLTPLKRAEEQARRLDRLAALGRFTSSVAHEIRNPLTGIAAGVQYLSRDLPAEGPQREHLSFILSEIKRLDGIVQDLFDITHPRGLQLRTLPLEDTAGRAIQVLRALTEERGVTLSLEVTPRTPAVPHDADQLEQVLINLVKNAVEASAPGQRVRVTLEPVGMPRGARRRALGPVGVVLRVEDEGAGISSENLKTIFEPFFTTKPGGTGLGLYISHDIVKRHGGSLTVHCESGRGTTFSVELPLEPNGGTP
jgi:PAS domain S-box-containing protein